MRRVVRTESGLVRRGARGIAFLWTLLIGFPLMFLGLAMAVDFTRMVIAEREMSTATQAAALAAAYQFTPGEATIDPARAQLAGVETMCVANSVGETHNASPSTSWRAACPHGGQASVRVEMLSTTEVQVTSWYTVPNLLFLSYFGSSATEQKVTRSAAVCDSRDASGPTGGYCQRPQS